MRMRSAPGVLFADGPAGRRAVIAGTGLDVWEVIAAWRAADEDFELGLDALSIHAIDCCGLPDDEQLRRAASDVRRSSPSPAGSRATLPASQAGP